MRAEPGLSVAPGPVARIRGAGAGIAGTGFFVGDRYVLTCAHVIDDALGRNRGDAAQPGDEIRLDLPFLDRTGLSGRVVAWRAKHPLDDLERDPVSDIAVLALSEPVPGGLATRAAVLSRPAVGTGFQTFGFPGGMDNGVEAGDELRMTDAGGWHQLRDTQAHSSFVEAGFSGAPVLALAPDREGRARLLGMVVAADVDPDKRLAFAIPTATLARASLLLARPCKELEAFGPEDAELFFGRNSFVEELVGKVAKRPFLTVIGPSGSGKSSVVIAGLVPRLRDKGGWAVAECRQPRRPLYQLAHAIAVLGADSCETKRALHARTEDLERQLRKDPGRILDIVETTLGMLPHASRLLLVIDQFEELFTLDAETALRSDGEADPKPGKDAETADAEKADAISTRVEEFVAVLEAIDRQPDRAPVIHAVATLRADFTGQALKVRTLAELMPDADVKLGPMTPTELSQAVEAPADRFGVSFAPGLVPEIVTRMARSLGGLPLMQFALDPLWQRQRDGALKRKDYAAIGGVEGALAEHAEAFWSDSSEADGDRLRRILLRFVRLAPPGEQAKDTRAVALRSEIGEDDWLLVRDLVAARLVMTGRDPVIGEETVEVVHEALIGAWPRLKAWLDEDRKFGLWRQRLRIYLDDHTERGTVLAGDFLAEAEAWKAAREHALNPAEIGLIEFSIEAKRAEEEASVKRQRTWVRRLSMLSFVLALFYGANGYFWWSAGMERDRAIVAAREATGRELAAEARLIQAEIGGAAAAERAVALSIESWRLLRNSTAYQVAATSLRKLPIARVENNGGVGSVAFSPDGTLLATASDDGPARAVDAESGAELARVEHGSTVTSVAFSPDGARLATASVDDTARTFEAHPSKLFDRLCKTSAGRNLTRDEWRQYVGDPADWRPTCPEWRTIAEYQRQSRYALFPVYLKLAGVVGNSTSVRTH